MNTNRSRGFTIVELLIVIVVIAILAAITIVAYNGIQNRANDSAVQSDLISVGKKLASELVIHGSLPVANDTGLSSLGLRLTKNAYSEGYNNGTGNYNFAYCRGDDATSYALIASSKSGATFMYQNGSVQIVTWSLASSGTICGNAARAGISPFTVRWFYNNGNWALWL